MAYTVVYGNRARRPGRSAKKVCPECFRPMTQASLNLYKGRVYSVSMRMQIGRQVPAVLARLAGRRDMSGKRVCKECIDYLVNKAMQDVVKEVRQSLVVGLRRVK